MRACSRPPWHSVDAADSLANPQPIGEQAGLRPGANLGARVAIPDVDHFIERFEVKQTVLAHRYIEQEISLLPCERRC